MPCDYDVIVVGGGPGGSSAARSCAQAGLKTLLVEKERMPRYKPCGGCLSPKTVNFLNFDLSSVIENTLYGAKFTYCLKDPFIIRSKEPISFMVMRDQFDLFLLKKALGEGAEILEGERVVKVEESDGRVEVELAKGETLCSEFLIGADGPGSVVAKSLSLSRPKGAGRGMGLEQEIPFEWAVDFPKDERELMHLDFGRIPGGYGWVFPKKDGLSVGIGGISRGGERVNPYPHFKDFKRGLNYIKGGNAGRAIGHPILSFYDEGQKVSQGKVLLVGDAGHLMDPLTGEGIYYALQSGRLAAEAIVQSKGKGGAPSQIYEMLVRNLIFGNLKWALHISQIIYRFTRFSYRTLKLYPELGEICLRVMEEKESYQGFVLKVKDRMKGLLKGHLSEKIRKALARA